MKHLLPITLLVAACALFAGCETLGTTRDSSDDDDDNSRVEEPSTWPDSGQTMPMPSPPRTETPYQPRLPRPVPRETRY